MIRQSRELTESEVDNVSGGNPLTMISIGIAVVSAGIALNNYLLAKGAADHDANCKQH